MSTAVVALIENSQGSTVAVRFSDIDSLYSWEEANPEVQILSVAPLLTRKEAIRA